MRFYKIALGIVFLGISVPALAQSPSGNQTMIYDIYAGGINAVQARLNVDTSKKGRYDMMLEARTRGFLAKLAPWQGTFETHGWSGTKAIYSPELHKSVAYWRDDPPEIKEYRYNKDGSFKSYTLTDDTHKNDTETVDADLTKNSTDALTGTMLVMQKVAEGQHCEGSSEVFDGDRRYRMTFKDEGTQQLEATRYNVYSGPAEQCSVEVEPLQGKWHEKPRGWLSIQEQGRSQGMLPTIWFAKLDKNGPAVPVKLRVKTDYGTLFLHLAEYHNGEGVRIAEKRAE